MTPSTKNGHAPPPVESRVRCQFVNPDYFDFSKGAEGVIKLTTPFGKSPAWWRCALLCLCVCCVCLCCVCVLLLLSFWSGCCQFFCGHVCRNGRTERVRALYAPLIEICCAAYKHTTTTTTPQPSPLSLLSLLPHFLSYHRKQQTPIRNEILRKSAGWSVAKQNWQNPTDDVENIMHTVTALNGGKRKATRQ